MKELELKEMMARHRQELSEKDITISSVSCCNLFLRPSQELLLIQKHTGTHRIVNAVNPENKLQCSG